MKMKWLMTVFMTAMLALTNGCALLVIGGVAAAASGVVYVNGELKETEGVSYDTAYDATLEAMTDLQYAVVTKQKESITAVVTATFLLK